MNKKPLPVSIIVTASGPAGPIEALLRALAQQDCDDALEVIVVGNEKEIDPAWDTGLADPTAPGLIVKVLDVKGAAIAAQRNRGAAAAGGRWLLFLDAQLVPCRGWVGAHLRALAQRPSGLVVGCVRMSWPDPSDFLNIRRRALWEDHFAAMRRPFHRFCFEDLFDGNFSVAAETFFASGGFDDVLQARELAEFAFRWIDSGKEVCFSSEALALRPRPERLEYFFAQQALAGQADAQMVRKHPSLNKALPQYHPRKAKRRYQKILLAAIMESACHLNFVHRAIVRVLTFSEWLRLRTFWGKLFRLALGTHYWTGYRCRYNKPAEAVCRLIGTDHHREKQNDLRIDLSQGWAAAQACMDTMRPEGVQLEFDHMPLGRIAPQPGAEKLRGAHLHLFLQNDPPWPLIVSVVLQKLDRNSSTVGFCDQRKGAAMVHNDAVAADSDEQEDIAEASFINKAGTVPYGIYKKNILGGGSR